ncbi:PREDICTED: olfactory receptor 6F1-like [Nanorana parkeri]|uniref:olfactory receptor 6F1-like n=1 Tax=Nanorana parkeri TaxID=125878 RepID=UPI00085420F9|nr:PREDICTED: olfactory receptor 6F1-like [Nanorana parkeri]
MPTFDNGNRTLASSFIIVGFETIREMELFLFFLFLCMYVITLGAHIIIIGLVILDHRLHKPMYMFLANFSVAEICYITATVPKMLDALLTRNKVISYSACMAQFYSFFAFGATENCFLVVMGYDRYVAICQPLHYHTMMAKGNSRGLAIGAWAGGLLAATSPTLWVSTLNFCYPNHIEHFFCDYAPLLKLSCEDTSKGEFAFTVISWSLILGCFSLTLVSYAFIIFSVLKIPSAEGQKKAFSTCASHITVVSIFNGTVIFMYIRPTSTIRFTLDKVVSIFYSIVTPLLNPIIYCLRNKDVKNAAYKGLQGLGI